MEAITLVNVDEFRAAAKRVLSEAGVVSPTLLMKLTSVFADNAQKSLRVVKVGSGGSAAP